MKDQRISLLITADVKKQLQQLAKQEDRSMNWLINHAIKLMLKDK